MEAPSTTQEREDLLRVVTLVLNTRKVASITCETSSKARNLRRKFYRLAEDFPSEILNSFSLRLIGHHVLIEPKANSNWQNSISLGDPVNASSPTGELPPSDRLDDKI